MESYKKFINNILETRGRFACGEEYHETHHIVPKCIGGNNDEDNLIDLFAREHFIAHKLLAEENPDNEKLVYAWWMMAHCKGRDYQDRYEVTPKEYEEARKDFVKIFSEKRKGFTYTEESKKKMSESHKGINAGAKHPMYGKHPSEETRKKLSESHKGYKAPDWVRQKISDGHKNPSQETREKISRALKGKYTGDKNSMYGKHHSDEEKEKIRKALQGSKSYRAKKVAQYNKDYELIQIWEYIKLAEETLGINHSHISDCCKGKRKSAGGFIWRYLDEENCEI